MVIKRLHMKSRKANQREDIYSNMSDKKTHVHKIPRNRANQQEKDRYNKYEQMT